MRFNTAALPSTIQAVPGTGSCAETARAMRESAKEERDRQKKCEQLYASYAADYGEIKSDDGAENALVRAVRIGQSPEDFDRELAEAVGESTT